MSEYEFVRIMQCPFCGHRSKYTGVGTIYCGPHGRGRELSPARPMYEVDGYWRHPETYESPETRERLKESFTPPDR